MVSKEERRQLEKIQFAVLFFFQLIQNTLLR
jgi:hypothetical protein